MYCPDGSLGSLHTSSLRIPHSQQCRRSSQYGGFLTSHYFAATSIHRLHSETLTAPVPSAGLDDHNDDVMKRGSWYSNDCVRHLYLHLSRPRTSVCCDSSKSTMLGVFFFFKQDSWPETLMLPSSLRYLCEDLCGKHRKEFNVIKTHSHCFLKPLTNRKKISTTRGNADYRFGEKKAEMKR